MNNTHLNTELLSGEARGRKHVPVAVFAVLFIHIALFLVLLIAAGCRARARAKVEPSPGPAIAAPAALPRENTAPLSLHPGESVIATEPEFDVAPVPAQAGQGSAPASGEEPAPGIYIVRPGDNLGAIARQHGTTVQAIKEQNNLKNDFIRAGQRLRVDSSTRERSRDA